MYLLQPLSDAWDRRDVAQGVVGVAATLGFGVAYITYFYLVRRDAPPGPPLLTRPFQPVLAVPIVVVVALTAVMAICIGESGLTAVPFLAVMRVVWLPKNVWGLVAGVTVGVAGWVLCEGP